MDVENILTVVRWEKGQGMDEKGDWIEKYVLVVTGKS